LDAYVSKKTANSESIRAYARFLEGYATLEQIDGEAWFRGDREEAFPVLDEAAEFFDEGRRLFLEAAEGCKTYRAWDDPERRGELLPDLDTFYKMAASLERMAAQLRARELPSLEQMHSTDELMRVQMIVGERKALSFRGTRGHFPLPDTVGDGHGLASLGSDPDGEA